MNENKIIEFDDTLICELYKELDKCYLKYNLTENERMFLSTIYAIEKQSYMTIKLIPNFYEYQKQIKENKGV